MDTISPAKKPAKKPAKATKASPSKKPAPREEIIPKKARPVTPQPKIAPPPPPTFVKEATAAERKAALQAILEREGVKELSIPTPHHTPMVSPPPQPPPMAPPSYVMESSPEARKAAVEALAEESGVKSALAKAPWKRQYSGPIAPPTAALPAPPVAPAMPGVPGAPPAAPPRTAPRVEMTKSPMAGAAGKSAPRTVILDSNALMMQFQFHVDIEKEVRRILNINFDVVVPSIVVDELNRLTKEGTGKEQAEARMAVELAKTFRIVAAPGDGDAGIMRLAESLNAVVVTNDKRLRAVLRAKDIPNIYMRSRAFLTLEGHIPGM